MEAVVSTSCVRVWNDRHKDLRLRTSLEIDEAQDEGEKFSVD